MSETWNSDSNLLRHATRSVINYSKRFTVLSIYVSTKSCQRVSVCSSIASLLLSKFQLIRLPSDRHAPLRDYNNIVSSGSKGGRTRRPPLFSEEKIFFFKYLLFAKQDSDLLRIQSTFERRWIVSVLKLYNYNYYFITKLYYRLCRKTLGVQRHYKIVCL